MTHSPLARAIKYLNFAIGVALAAALGIAYWYAWRPLARYSGEVSAPVAAAVSVSFDELGVPHIRGGSLEDALFVQGYVTAQERLWQMDSLRRLAAGDLSEVVGPAALESDRESRRMRMRRIAEAAYSALPAADRAAFAAYSRGVNHFLASNLGNLPLEFRLLGYQPRPWSVVDCILVGLYMFRDLTTTWRDELVKRDMLAAGDKAKVEYLFPVGTGLGPLPGSNGWAIAGGRTASGKPLLSSDMHLAFGLPGIWYMAQLEAPGLDVGGVTLPGVPGVIVGHNRRIAWGITNLGFDVQDLYIEKFDDRTGRYLFRGQVEQASAERELIRVKGQPAAELLLWVTRHGPLFVTEGGDRMALRWAAAEPGMFQFPFLEINRAGDWREFTAAIGRFSGPGSNFVYADADGNIGYHAAGKLPVRRGYAGDVPVDGASGDFEWQGWIPFDELPSAYNPPGGMVVTANQNPFPAGYAYPVNGAFAPPWRARQIRDRLTARKGWKPQDSLALQSDVYSGFNQFLATQLAAAYGRRGVSNPGLEPAVTLLRQWDGQMSAKSGAALLATLARHYVQVAAAERAAPNSGRQYDYAMAPAAIEKLLRERPAGWFDDYDGMLLRALADSVEEGRRMQGPDVKRWQWGEYQKIAVNHPVIHQLPLVGRYFDIGPAPMSGSGTSIKQVTRTLAPSMRMNADAGDWDRSLLNIPIGQSGQILSSHYRDQWKAFYYGLSFPMQFRSVKAAHTLTFRP